MSERQREARPERLVSTEAIGTLIWLLENHGVDRRRYSILNRLRAVRDSDQFQSLPEALREKVRQVVAESEAG